MKILFPQMRYNVYANLITLSDQEFLEDIYLHGGLEKLPYEPIDEAIHALFDDSGFDEGVESQIGNILYSDHEALLIRELMNCLDAVQGKKEYFMIKSNAPYITDSDWPKVVAAAKAAKEEFERNGVEGI